MGVCRFHLTGRTYSYLEGIRLNCPIDRVSDGIDHPFSRISLSCRQCKVSHNALVSRDLMPVNQLADSDW